MEVEISQRNGGVWSVAKMDTNTGLMATYGGRFTLTDGFLNRISYPVVLPHVEYSLTPLGEQVSEKIVRHTDNAVLSFQKHSDARACLDALKQRLDKFGLKVHPGKNACYGSGDTP